MGRIVICVCFLTISSLILQGCDFAEREEVKQDVKKIEKDVERDLPMPPAMKTSAKCNGGHFHCDGGWKEWCARMKKQCKPKDCAPMCAWTCDSPVCNKECGPVCNQPACSTRCKGFNTDSCKMKCGKPNCKVVCPKHFCPSEDCAACKTECGKPKCTMECGVDEQPCRHVCAQPVCKWECKDPQLCPKPKCEMKCKKQPDCMQKMHMFSKVPPLEPGETEIVTATDGGAPAPAPASFLQSASGISKMNVNFTRMDEDHTLHRGQVNLAVEHEDSMASGAESWSRMVSEHAGRMIESSASCEHGKFHCDGDASWCADQKEIVCKDVATVRRHVNGQSHLQA